MSGSSRRCNQCVFPLSSLRTVQKWFHSIATCLSVLFCSRTEEPARLLICRRARERIYRASLGWVRLRIRAHTGRVGGCGAPWPWTSRYSWRGPDMPPRPVCSRPTAKSWICVEAPRSVVWVRWTAPRRSACTAGYKWTAVPLVCSLVRGAQGQGHGDDEDLCCENLRLRVVIRIRIRKALNKFADFKNYSDPLLNSLNLLNFDFDLCY